MLFQAKSSSSQRVERRMFRLWTLALVAVVVCGVVYCNSATKQVNIETRVYAEDELTSAVKVAEKLEIAAEQTCGTRPELQVCIPAGGSGRFAVEFGSWVAPSTGVISGLELTWVSGELKECGNLARDCRGRWGITSPAYGYSIYVTRSDGTLIYPTSMVTDLVMKLDGHYQFGATTLTVADVDSPTFTMTFGSNIFVREGETLRFYNAQVMTQIAWSDNLDQTCATVRPFYEPSSTQPSNEVCIPAGSSGRVDSEFGKWVVPSTGVISGVMLTWVAGEMLMCGWNSARNCRGRWGITAGDFGYAVYLTRDDGSAIYPTGTTPNVLVRAAGAYRFSVPLLTVAEVDSPTFTMDFGTNIFVRQGEVLRFYHAEVVVQEAFLRNLGTTCVTVTPRYVQPQPSLQSSVCIPAGWINAFGSVFAPRGGIVSSVTLRRTSGQMTYCGGCVGTFGSVVTEYQIFVTRANEKQVLFPIGGTRGYERATHRQFNGYRLTGSPNALNGDTLTLELGEQSVAQGEELKFWAGEVLFASSNRAIAQANLRDNSGRLCVDVELNYANVTDRLCRDFTIEMDCVVSSCFRCEWNNVTRACTCRSAAKDFVFLVDGSSSIASGDFAEQSQVVDEIIRHMVSINSGVGVVQFASTLQTEIALFPRSSTASVLSAVNNMAQLGGNTAIGDAMDFALTSTTMLGNAQVRSESWIVLITDGKNTAGMNPCDPRVTGALRSRGVRVLIVGVSAGFDRAGVECLVEHEANNTQHIIEMPNFSLMEFLRVAPTLDDQICN